MTDSHANVADVLRDIASRSVVLSNNEGYDSAERALSHLEAFMHVALALRGSYGKSRQEDFDREASKLGLKLE